MNITRFKAAVFHLAFSLIIVGILISIMLTVWYPGNYFALMGGEKLIFIIAGVDIFLGPMLTLIIFNPAKKSLKFDLTCIALFQILAMSYGTYVMFQARPVFTVFNKTAFQVVSALDIDSRELVLGKKEEWRTLSVSGPKLVAIGTPDKANKKETTFAMVVSNEAASYPRLYDTYLNHKKEVIDQGKPLERLLMSSSKNKAVVDNFIQREKLLISELLFLPATSPLNKMIAVVNSKTGEFIDILDINLGDASLKNQ